MPTINDGDASGSTYSKQKNSDRRLELQRQTYERHNQHILVVTPTLFFQCCYLDQTKQDVVTMLLVLLEWKGVFSPGIRAQCMMPIGSRTTPSTDIYLHPFSLLVLLTALIWKILHKVRRRCAG